MTRIGIRGCVSALALGALAVTSFAGDMTSPTRGGDELARLESLLEAQQRKIDALERQVSSGDAMGMNAARVENIKEQIREVLGEREFRESLMPTVLTAGYDDGFYIKSSDDNFMLKVNGLLQVRWQHYGTRADNRYLLPGLQRDDKTGFDVQRARVRFSGHAYSPDWTYNIEMRADAIDAWDWIVHEAWVNYRAMDEFQIRAGVMRLASTRAQMTYEGNLQFVDRPMVDAVFGLGRGMGVRFWGHLWDKQATYYIDYVDGTGDETVAALNRTITPDRLTLSGGEKDGNPAILARFVWHVMGDDPETDWISQADLAHRESPALDIGMHYAFNDDRSDLATTRLPAPSNRRFRQGGYVLTNLNGVQMHQVGVDAAFKYRGFSTTAEYIMRTVDPRNGRFTPWTILTNEGSTSVQHGAYMQMGYFLPIPGMEDKLEAVVRVGGISAMGGGTEGSWEYAGGLNYYIQGDNVKLQTDITRIYESPISNNYSSLANVNDDVLVWRVQLQVAF